MQQLVFLVSFQTIQMNEETFDKHWMKSLQKGNYVHDETLGQDQQNGTFQE